MVVENRPTVGQKFGSLKLYSRLYAVLIELFALHCCWMCSNLCILCPGIRVSVYPRKGCRSDLHFTARVVLALKCFSLCEFFQPPRNTANSIYAKLASTWPYIRDALLRFLKTIYTSSLGDNIRVQLLLGVADGTTQIRRLLLQRRRRFFESAEKRFGIGSELFVLVELIQVNLIVSGP